MPNKQLVTVTLNVASWNAIMQFIEESCGPKGFAWRKWGQEVTEAIQAAIYKANPEAKRADDEKVRTFLRQFRENQEILDNVVELGEDMSEYDASHDPDFGQWIDTGAGMEWDSYVDDD